MFKYLLTLALFTILLVPTVFADDGISQKISNSSNDSINPFVATDGTNIYVTWTDQSRSGQGELFFSKSTDGGQTFSAPKNISNKQGDSIASFVTTDGTNIYVTWTYRYKNNPSGGGSGENSEIYFSKSADGGQTFSTPQKISSDFSFAVGSKMALDGQNVFLTWTVITRGATLPENTEIYFAKSTDGGETFTEPQNISNDTKFSQSPYIITNVTNIFVTWSNDLDDGTVIYFSKSTDGGKTFSPTLNLSNNTRYSTGPSLATDGSNIFIVWMYGVKGENYDILFSKSTDGGETFTEPQNISNTPGFSTMPTIAVFGSNIFVTWVDDQTKASPILFSKSTDGGQTFSTPQTISSSTGFSSFQSVATDGINIFNAWSWAERSPEDKQVVIFSKSSIVSHLTENTDEMPKNDTGLTVPQVNGTQSTSDISTPTVKDIKWLNENGADYSVGGIGVIRLDNSELNVNKQLIDIPVVHVWSDTDAKGITVDMIETGADTGVFYADINLSREKSTTLQLQVSNGDTLTASFEDESLDEPLVDTAKIIPKYLSPVEQLAQNTPIDKIICKDNYKLVIKDSVKPFCLTERTYEKLLARGFFTQ